MPLLPPHPFAVSAFFRQSLVLTYAVPAETLAARVPHPLAVDTYDDRWAFVAVAMVQTEGLRPRGFPAWLGNDFFLAGYRIFVRYRNRAGKRLRGLYILESQTDRRRMKLMGNLMTHYNYRRIDVQQETTASTYAVRSVRAGFAVRVRFDAAPPLPAGSPFPDWKTARRYAGPLPFTFTLTDDGREVIIVEGVRQNWQPRPVTVVGAKLDWLAAAGLPGAQLASAFVVQNIPYLWRRGRREAIETPPA